MENDLQWTKFDDLGFIMNAHEKLKHSFKDIFVRKDIKKITITELTAAAKVNRKTFYHYFYTMDDVLNDINQDLLNDLLEAISEMTEFTIHNFLVTLNSLVEKNGRFYTALVQQRKNQFFLTDAEIILKEGLAKALKLDLKNANINFQLSFFSGGIIEMYSYWLKDSQGVTLDQLVKIADEKNSIVKKLLN